MRASVASSSTSLLSTKGARSACALFLRADRSFLAAVGVSYPSSSSPWFLFGVENSTFFKGVGVGASLVPLAFCGVPRRMDLRLDGVSAGLSGNASFSAVRRVFLGVGVFPLASPSCCLFGIVTFLTCHMLLRLPPYLSTLRVSKARAAQHAFHKARAGLHNPETAVTSRIPPRPCEILITDILRQKESGLVSIAARKL